jgi:hypothetical protein
MQRGQSVEICTARAIAYFSAAAEFPTPKQPSETPKEETLPSEIEEIESEITSFALDPLLSASSAFCGRKAACTLRCNTNNFLFSNSYQDSNSGLYLRYCCLLI